jgi:uncharacterized membrane protein YfcA
VTVSDRLYTVRRPVAAVAVGAAVALLGGLIGLGGAEFRLPLLIAVFELLPHRAVRINLLISFATLAVAAVARLGFASGADVSSYGAEIVAMLLGGMIAAWVGAGLLARIPKGRVMAVIAVMLAGVAVLLVLETTFAGSSGLALPDAAAVRIPVAVLAGLIVGAVSSLLGVAGGELIIPILMFVFGTDIKTAGTASVLISAPVVLTGIARHWRSGYYRSRSVFMQLTAPMSLGSAAGAVVGGYMAAWAPSDALRVVLAVILAAAAVKLMLKRESE